MSMKNAPTRGTTTKALAEAPNFSVTAVMLAIAVGRRNPGLGSPQGEMEHKKGTDLFVRKK
jgi:hypothetical protein